ncbi:CCN family member 3-like [Physella acuta]|uniref:CCN family member 3-like n=1 Tax=Physella acuta TaxID=109671 RepID=UPI0027DB8511|nr:CCN family member 3-like [Physella acuta]
MNLCRHWLQSCLAVLAFISCHSLADRSSDIPCLGCRLFNLQHRNQPDDKKSSGLCHYPCQCPVEEISCTDGVRLVKDGCSCCYMCARQLGESCTTKDVCDSHQGLYCDRVDAHSPGKCRSKEKNPCHVNGVVYKDGEKFQPECSQLCTCQNGYYGCINQCPHELQKPSELTCHDPTLIKSKNKCCREWTCQKMDSNGTNFVHLGLESQNLIHKYLVTPTTSVPTTTFPPSERRICKPANTNWSPCSASCDEGVSVKLTVDSLSCQPIQHIKICFLRPCSHNVSTTFNKGLTKCTPTTRSIDKHHIHYQDIHYKHCVSVKAYKLKFCTTCKSNKCCYPQKTRTRLMEFQCQGRHRLEMKYLWLKKCRCDNKCYQKDEKHRKRNRRN